MGMQFRSVLIAAAALSMASCGGGGDASPLRQGPQIPKVRLIAQGDAICRQDLVRVEARLRAEGRLARVRATQRRGRMESLAPFLAIDAQAIRTGAGRIEALGRPREDAKLLDGYLNERTTAADNLGRAATAARKRDNGALDAALEAYGRNQARAAAAEFGFKVCGVGAGRREVVVRSLLPQ